MTSEARRAHNTEGKIQTLADPTLSAGTFGKETDSVVPLLGNQQFKRFSPVIEISMGKALNVEPNGTGLSCSPAPKSILQL